MCSSGGFSNSQLALQLATLQIAYDMAVHFNLRSYLGLYPIVFVVTNLIQRHFSWYGSNDLKKA